MKDKTTERGFRRIEFVDRSNVACSLQKSSVASEDCIWLGCNNIGLKRLHSLKGWVDVDIASLLSGAEFVANNRMHLSQQQVKDLLPYLEYFAEHGELPSTDEMKKGIL